MLFSDTGACKVARNRHRSLNDNANTGVANHLAPGGSAGIASDPIFPPREFPLPTILLL
jgi:hypothetical protein